MASCQVALSFGMDFLGFVYCRTPVPCSLVVTQVQQTQLVERMCPENMDWLVVNPCHWLDAHGPFAQWWAQWLAPESGLGSCYSILSLT